MAEDVGKIVSISGCAASILSSYKLIQRLATQWNQISILNTDLLKIGYTTYNCNLGIHNFVNKKI